MSDTELTAIPGDEPLQTDQTEQESDSYVGECGVTVCRFNKMRRCYAGSIEVALVNGMAHCATFDPKVHSLPYRKSEPTHRR